MTLMYIHLEGLLQSYGVDDCWENRSTSAFPTKSAVIGMLGAALGYEYGDVRLKQLTEQLKMSVRENKKSSIMTDYQNIRAHRTPEQSHMKFPLVTPFRELKNANGSKSEFEICKSGRNKNKWIASAAKQRNKDYLINASYTVFLEGERALLIKLCDALLDPAHGLYLGRRCCIPSAPILGYLCDYDAIEEAWKHCDVNDNNAHVVEYEDDGKIELGIERLTRRDSAVGNYIYVNRSVCRKEIITQCT